MTVDNMKQETTLETQEKEKKTLKLKLWDKRRVRPWFRYSAKIN